MATKLGPALAERAATADPDDRLEVQIFLRRDPTVWDPESSFQPLNRRDLSRAVKESAQQSRERFLDQIGSGAAPLVFREIGRNWINNSLAAEVSPDTLRTILDLPEVEHVELVARADLEDLLDGPVEPAFVDPPLPSPMAPAISQHVKHVNAPRLWKELGLRGNGVVVAVIDTGIDFNHPDLDNRRWNGGPSFPHHGFDFRTPDLDPKDEHGHGTSCAGLIAGDGSLGLFTGAAPEASLMALRVGTNEGHAWSAFQFAIDHDADVVSMSMGWSAKQKPNYHGWRVACELLLKAGIVHVCSAGKKGSSNGIHKVPFNMPAPAICPPPWLHPAQPPGRRSSAIACGETDLMDRKQPLSGRGPGAWETLPFADYPFKNGGQGILKPDFCAPGRGAHTCNLRFVSNPGAAPHVPFAGTSAATALAAGCAALLVEAAKRFGEPVLPERIQEALERTAVRVQGQTQDKENHFGSGRIDVFEAYQYGLSRKWWK